MKKRILIVDDAKEIVELTQKLLEARGYEVIALLHGNLTLATAKECKPDIILLDMILEDKTGLELCQEIKTAPETKNIPVIITTGHEQASQENIPPGLQPNDYMVKPFDLDELLSKIREFIQ